MSVLNHDFGYGKDCKQINKLTLNNIEDVKIYINELAKDLFIAHVNDCKITFLSDQITIQVIVEQM